MTISLSPQTGKFVLRSVPCRIEGETDEDTIMGPGEVSLDAHQLLELRETLDKLQTMQHWKGPDGSATVMLLRDGSWAVWSSEGVPNLGPLRTQDDYRRQVVMFRAAGMRPEGVFCG